MALLNYSTLRASGYKGYILENAPERVLQFGEGNFLRAFADYWFDLANERAGWNGKCALVQPTPNGASVTERIHRQQGLYTLCLRGMENGARVDRRRVISSVSRCVNPYDAQGFEALMALAESKDLEFVVSNTTEAGIVYDPACAFTDTPCASFPGKLTQVLYRRWQSGGSGLVILPCELIDDNGRVLRECVCRYVDQWGLGEDFRRYINEECTFCSTLVDRIVPGRVRDEAERARLDRENGYEDALIDVSEVFGVWIIEGPEWLNDRLPFRAAGVNCVVVPDVAPYKKRKVRILNGAHTGFVPGAYLAGFDIVRDCMENGVIRGFMNRMLREEIIPVLPLDRKDLEEFAAAVQDRFNNPFIDHALLSISLNTTSKWRVRNLPSLIEYAERFGTLPKCLAMSFAAYIAFYTCGVEALDEKGLRCRCPDGTGYCCSDDRWILEFFFEHRNDDIETLTRCVMENERMWGMALTSISGFLEITAQNLHLIREKGALAAFASCL